eukprot:bmy_11989T0
MHQIYSCSDENIEVFTTVIPSKVRQFPLSLDPSGGNAGPPPWTPPAFTSGLTSSFYKMGWKTHQSSLLIRGMLKKMKTKFEIPVMRDRLSARIWHRGALAGCLWKEGTSEQENESIQTSEKLQCNVGSSNLLQRSEDVQNERPQCHGYAFKHARYEPQIAKIPFVTPDIKIKYGPFQWALTKVVFLFMYFPKTTIQQGIIIENTLACSAPFWLARISTYRATACSIVKLRPALRQLTGPSLGPEGPGSDSVKGRLVVIESDLYASRPLELLQHRSDHRDGEGRRSGRFQNARPQGAHPAKTPARPGTCVTARVPGTSLGGSGPLRAAATVSATWLVLAPATSWSSRASSITPGGRSTCAWGRRLPQCMPVLL